MIPKNRPPTHPGVILLKHFLQPMGVSQAEFIRCLDQKWTKTKLNEIIREKRGLSLDAALDLADVLGTSPEFWINLQMNYDLWAAQKRHKKINATSFLAAISAAS